jgi:hypothetical protein
VLARLICFVGDDLDDVRDFARWLLTPYLVVPGYNRFVAAQGFEREAKDVATKWTAGDRQGALASITDELIDALVIAGPAAACKERLASLQEAGLDTPVLLFMSQRGPDAIRSAIDEMAP